MKNTGFANSEMSYCSIV